MNTHIPSCAHSQVLSLVVRIHVERVYPRIQRHEPLNSDVRRRFRAARVGLWDVNDPPAAGYTLEALSVRVGWSTREVGWAAHGSVGIDLVAAHEDARSYAMLALCSARMCAVCGWMSITDWPAALGLCTRSLRLHGPGARDVR